MKTVQKYGEGADHASPIEDSATTPPQSAENATSTVEPSYEQPPLPANSFTFDELASFSELPNEGKVIICSLLEANRYEPDQISKALVLLSHSPSITSIEDEALQALLCAPEVESSFTRKDTDLEMYEPITVRLPFFLRHQIRDANRTKHLLAAIGRVFHEFNRSKTGGTIRDDVDQMLAYAAMEYNFTEIIEKASKQIGTYAKPDISEFLFETPKLDADGNPFLNNEAIYNTPLNCSDVDQLQDWVSTLQKMAHLQLQIVANHERMQANCEKQVHALEQIISIQNTQVAELKGQVAERQLQIDTYKSNEVRAKKKQEAPSQCSHIELPLFLKGGYESEIEMVRCALEEAADAKLKTMLESIVNGETEEAFFIKEDYDRLRAIIGRLAEYAAILSDENYSSLEYHQSAAQYLHITKYQHNQLMARKSAFVDAYSTSEEPEEETSTGKPNQPATTQE